MSTVRRKILHVYKDYYPPVYGGIERSLGALARGARDSGFDVSVLVANRGSAPTQEQRIGGISVIRVKKWGRFQSAPICPTFPFWFRKLARRADILHFHCPNPTGEISYLLSGIKKKVVVSYYSDIVRQRRALRYYRFFLETFLRRADVICPLTENYILGSAYLRPLAHKCRPIALGVDVAQFAKEPPPEHVRRIYDQYGENIILFLGVFRHYKGIRELICAASELQGASLVMIGEGPLFVAARGWGREKALARHVFLLGELSDEEARAYLHACKFLVLPSTNRAEAFGLVLLEAMACGKPVISTELGTGTSYVNQHGRTGLVIPPRDVEALGAAMRDLLEKDGLRCRMGEEARRRVQQHFSLGKMIGEYISLYEQLLR